MNRLYLCVPSFGVLRKSRCTIIKVGRPDGVDMIFENFVKITVNNITTHMRRCIKISLIEQLITEPLWFICTHFRNLLRLITENTHLSGSDSFFCSLLSLLQPITCSQQCCGQSDQCLPVAKHNRCLASQWQLRCLRASARLTLSLWLLL